MGAWKCWARAGGRLAWPHRRRPRMHSEFEALGAHFHRTPSPCIRGRLRMHSASAPRLQLHHSPKDRRQQSSRRQGEQSRGNAPPRPAAPPPAAPRALLSRPIPSPSRPTHSRSAYSSHSGCSYSTSLSLRPADPTCAIEGAAGRRQGEASHPGSPRRQAGRAIQPGPPAQHDSACHLPGEAPA